MVMSGMQGLKHRHEFSRSLIHLFPFHSRPLQKWTEVSDKEASPGFISLMRFLQYSLVSSRFFVLLRYSYYFFSLYPLLSWYLLPLFLSFRKFILLRAFWSSLGLVILFLPLCVVSCFLLLAWHSYDNQFTRETCFLIDMSMTTDNNIWVK